jgi:hypothetical protein
MDNLDKDIIREESKIEDRFFDNENDPSLLWIPPAAGLALCFMIGARFSVLSQYIKDNLGQVLAYDFESIGQEIVSHKLTLLASGAVIFFSIFFAVIASGLRKVSLRKLDVLSFDKNWDLGFKSLMTFANRLFSFFQNNRLELYAAFYFIFLFFMISQISGLELSLPF